MELLLKKNFNFVKTTIITFISMTFTELCNPIFVQVIADYHKTDHVDTPINNPYELKSIEYYLYLKNWIDTVQWHFEDIIRDPNINPEEALILKVPPVRAAR